VIALNGLAGAHGNLPNPAVSTTSAAGVMRRSKPNSSKVYDFYLHRGKEVIKQASRICYVKNIDSALPPYFTYSRECARREVVDTIGYEIQTIRV